MPIKYFHTTTGKSTIRGCGLKVIGYGHITPPIHSNTIIKELPSVGKKPKNIRF